MRDRHPPRFGWMLELDMTSLLSDLNPTVCSNRGNDVSRIHEYLYTPPWPNQVYKYTSDSNQPRQREVKQESQCPTPLLHAIPRRRLSASICCRTRRLVRRRACARQW